MNVLECPLCCGESFTDIFSLENHLLDLCENIVCPICELQFKTIKTLAWHIGQECNSVSKQSNIKNVEVLSHSANQDSSELTNENHLLKDDNDAGVAKKALIIKEVAPTDKVSTKTSSLPEKFIANKDSTYDTCNPYNEDQLEIESETVYEESVEDNLEYSASLYSCSVCNVTFSSVEEHLNKFHQDENVFVDHNVNEYANEINNERTTENDRSEDIAEKIDNSEYITKESNSLIWTQDEISNLLIVNWDSKVDCLMKSENNLIENPVFENLNNSYKGHWILTSNGYYISDSEKVEETNDLLNISVKEDRPTTTVIGNNHHEEWPESLREYPLATFVMYNKLDSNGDIIYSWENKSYLFNDHRVRLLKISRREGPLKIEDIPFPEEPPDCIRPFLEQVHDVPEDLAGSFAVMWPCHLCGATAFHWSDLAKHCCSSSTKYYPCTLCKKSFQTRRSLNSHYSVVHRVAHLLNGCFPCPLCPAKVQTSSHLEKHLAMHKKNDLVKCDFCKSMVQKSTYPDHVKAHGKNGSLHLVCQLCNRPFKGESELQLHMPQCHLKSHEEDNLKCQICKLNFEEIKSLRNHMVSHGIPIKLHLCSFCPKSYNRLIDKVIHERVHTKSKPYSCSECGRCFRLRHSLMAHMRIHTGERPFKCSSCSRTFRTKHLQRSHFAIHSGLYQYKCRYCNKQFRSKEKVEAHENSHKNPFVCDECKRIFYSLGFAKKHMENHKKKQLKYSCNMCPNMFTRAAYLESHLRTKHGLDTPTSISISTQKTYEQMEGSSYH